MDFEAFSFGYLVGLVGDVKQLNVAQAVLAASVKGSS